jgi:uncharacterized ion transporter superfamily protein YfcC
VPSYLVVTAFQAANGLVNLVTPTSAVVMGGLAIARVGYGVWLKFVPVVLILLMLLSILVLAVGTLAVRRRTIQTSVLEMYGRRTKTSPRQ